MPDQWETRLDRRTLLKAGLAGGAAIGAGAGIWAATQGGGSQARPGAPNILVIVVDQMRFPMWSSGERARVALPPQIARLRRGAVSFAHHYTASNDCTPARATLLTGLYTHQTGCLLTGSSTLSPAFPTFGTMLRQHGYRTYWFGKWHLTRGDHHWDELLGAPIMDSYGFGGGTYPSPNGAPGQGWRADPKIVEQFRGWFAAQGAGAPWCTTVSLINPHDIAWWYTHTNRFPPEAYAPAVAHRLPPNFETPEELARRRKPSLQRSLQETSAQAFGPVPFRGGTAHRRWRAFLDLYIKLEHAVDEHVGQVMRILHSNPAVAANTVVVFTSDHGEYGGSHGLRGKGAGAYEEAIRVPLIVRDPTGTLTRAPERLRTQLTSSVDVAPLLLTIAAGSDAWRREPRYAHLAGRLKLEQLLADPHAHGRPYVLHATDELVSEFAEELYNAPLHVVALRTRYAKFATYSNWEQNAIAALALEQEHELYDYRTQRGRLEIDNVAGRSRLEQRMRTMLERAMAEELRAPLPADLAAAQAAGFEDYFSNAKHGVIAAARHRRARARKLAKERRRRQRQQQRRQPTVRHPKSKPKPPKRHKAKHTASKRRTHKHAKRHKKQPKRRGT